MHKTGVIVSKMLLVSQIAVCSLVKFSDAITDPRAFAALQTAGSALNTSLQVNPAFQNLAYNTNASSKLTSQDVTQHLQLVRANAIQPAVMLFQTQDAAKMWRKRGQAQAVHNIYDSDIPRSPAEEREYVKMLKIAFKYMGPDCRYTQQEQVFLTRQQTEETEKEIESWCWQLLQEITRRQFLGRPTTLVKRKNAYMNKDSLTFAQRFSAVHNALKLEKRCCIRFSNMAGWHTRLANDPVSELAELQKNDEINDKRAMNRKAEMDATKELTRELEEVKSKEKSRKRARATT